MPGETIRAHVWWGQREPWKTWLLWGWSWSGANHLPPATAPLWEKGPACFIPGIQHRQNSAAENFLASISLPDLCLLITLPSRNFWATSYQRQSKSRKHLGWENIPNSHLGWNSGNLNSKQRGLKRASPYLRKLWVFAKKRWVSSTLSVQQ